MEYFRYNVGTVPYKEPGPIWPDFSQNSEWSQKLIRTKQAGGPGYWDSMQEIIAHDCDTLPFERFKVWASVLSVPFMSQSRASEYIRIGLEKYKIPLIKNALDEPPFGLLEDIDLPSLRAFSDIPVTMNRLQHFGHLEIAKSGGLGNIQDKNVILEIGAGIGDMADIIHKLGFKGRYIIFDLPEVSRIQKWYHEKLGLNIEYISDPEELKDLDVDVTIATWSLTEMPLDLREKILNNLQSAFWLLAYSKNILGFDNEKWVKERFIPSVGKSTEVAIPWMPWDGGTNYLFCLGQN